MRQGRGKADGERAKYGSNIREEIMEEDRARKEGRKAERETEIEQRKGDRGRNGYKREDNRVVSKKERTRPSMFHFLKKKKKRKKK